MALFKRMNRERRKRYWLLREIRQERDYQVGLLQYANRPYSKPSVRIPRKALTTNLFIKKYNINL
jgi:hypothetical protein